MDSAINAAVDLHGEHSCLNYANNNSNENMSEYGFIYTIYESETSAEQEKLFNTLVNCFGLNVGLWGGINKQRAPRCGPNSPFTDITSTDGSKFLRYREDTAKTNTGGVKHRTISETYINHENCLKYDIAPRIWS